MADKLKLSNTTIAKLSSAPIVNGQLLFTQDTSQLFWDIEGIRKEITNIVILDSEDEKDAILTPITGKFYFVIESSSLYFYNGLIWVAVTVDMSKTIIAEEIDGITDPITPTFGGHTVDEFVLKTELGTYATDQELADAISGVNETLSTTTQNVSDLSSRVSTNENNISTNTTNIGNAQSKADSAYTLAETANNNLNNYLPLSGGSLTGVVTAQNNENYLLGQVRNIYISTSEPTASDGNNGDIWLMYEL